MLTGALGVSLSCCSKHYVLILKKLHERLLWAAHLLVIFLMPGVYVFLLYRGGDGSLPLYVLWPWEWLARLLPFGVAGLLVWRRWGQVVALALLIGVDVVVRYGYYLAFFASSMSVILLDQVASGSLSNPSPANRAEAPAAPGT